MDPTAGCDGLVTRGGRMTTVLVILSLLCHATPLSCGAWRAVSRARLNANPYQRARSGWESAVTRATSLEEEMDHKRSRARASRYSQRRERILKQKKDADGHLVVNLCDANGVRTTHRVDRLVLSAFVGPCPPGMDAYHIDGNLENNKLSNLRWDIVAPKQEGKHDV